MTLTCRVATGNFRSGFQVAIILLVHSGFWSACLLVCKGFLVRKETKCGSLICMMMYFLSHLELPRWTHSIYPLCKRRLCDFPDMLIDSVTVDWIQNQAHFDADSCHEGGIPLQSCYPTVKSRRFTSFNSIQHRVEGFWMCLQCSRRKISPCVSKEFEPGLNMPPLPV